MRTHEELGREYAEAVNSDDNKKEKKLKMEVLLDIRDLLEQQNQILLESEDEDDLPF